MLPTPFILNSTALSNKNYWACRRFEISSMIQTFEFGQKPPTPTVTTTLHNNKLTITCNEAGKSVSFLAALKIPLPGHHLTLPSLATTSQSTILTGRANSMICMAYLMMLED
ncbi:hypothetical protein BDZ45DRAFT_749627 [Acephala macrosclerotiorum]|nr:hypothetical protein BDZ45DRAFT_749627 [Acephala macrosclerotiorum]